MTEIENIAKGLRRHEVMALDFLYAEVEHEIGVLDTEPKLAAAMAFCDMAKAGLIHDPVFPITRLTPKGLAVRDYLKQQEERDDG